MESITTDIKAQRRNSIDDYSHCRLQCIRFCNLSVSCCHLLFDLSLQSINFLIIAPVLVSLLEHSLSGLTSSKHPVSKSHSRSFSLSHQCATVPTAIFLCFGNRFDVWGVWCFCRRRRPLSQADKNSIAICVTLDTTMDTLDISRDELTITENEQMKSPTIIRPPIRNVGAS